MTRKLSKETIEKIREDDIIGKSRYQIARECGISANAVYNYTKDIPSSGRKDPCIRGKALELLKELLSKGYVHTEKNRSYLRVLQKHFPMIKRSQYKVRSIYYLEDKNKTALQMMVKHEKSRVINYQDLASAARVFGVKLSTDEKHSLFGKKTKPDLRIMRRREGGYISCYKKSQTNLDDFMDKNDFPGNSVEKNNRKNRFQDMDLTGETDGFLGRFLHSEVL